MRRWIWLTLLSIGLAACVGGAQMVTVSEAPAIRQGESIVVFIRPSGFGQAISASVFDVSGPETKFIGLVPYGSKVAYPVKPGEHTFMVVSEAADFLQATVTAGRTYYVLVTPRIGVWKARFSFRPIRQHDIDGPEFAGWSSSTQFMANSPEALDWAARNAADFASKRAQYWTEWASKPEHQRASQTLKAEDGRPGASTGTPSAAASSAERVETVFWQGIRSSANAADFRAYLEQYPNGLFAPTAREKVAALAPAPSAAASASGGRLPQPGDSWVYRYTHHRETGGKQRKYEVKVVQASERQIVERYSMEGLSSGESKHSPGAHLVALEASVFSPYLAAFQDLAAEPVLGEVRAADPFCARMPCTLTARVVGREVVRVPAGSFDAIKVRIDHAWPNWQREPPGNRQISVWYAPAVKRVVKLSSRSVAGRYSAIVGDFDFELAAYQLK
jgi:hypothetical protein